MQYINEKDWKEFEEKFPDAYNFLIARDLKGEYNILKRMHEKHTPNEYEKKRFEELKRLMEE